MRRLTAIRYITSFLLLLTLFSCRKSLQPSPTENPQPVTIQFSASAFDTNAKLTVQIFDTDSKHVYYSGTTNTNSYSGSTDILQGTSVTYSVTSSTNTNVTSQISNNNQVISTGNFNAQQSQGVQPQVVLYYKIP